MSGVRRQVAVADELWSIVQAILNDREPKYGAQQGRLDQEMDLAMGESGRVDCQDDPPLPLRSPTTSEAKQHEQFERAYGCALEKIEKMVDIFFSRP